MPQTFVRSATVTSSRTWRAPDAVAERLAAYAQENGISQNEAITRAVDAMVNGDGTDDVTDATGSGVTDEAGDADVVALLSDQLEKKDAQISELMRLLDQQQQVTVVTARRSIGQAIRGLFHGPSL